MLKKLEMYGVIATNVTCFTSYLNGRKQCIKITESADTVKKDIKCGVPQGSILEPLLFLLYVNDLPNCSSVLVPIMFANNTIFFEHFNINTLFNTVNDELNRINECFSASKLSLDAGKNKFPLFHKSGKKYSIFYHLQTLKINNHDIEIDNTMRFLGVLLDDNLLWKEHTKYLENKLAINKELIYRAKSFLEKESLLALLYSLIHSYLNCANLAWGSTYLTNLKKTTQETRVAHNLNIHKNFSNQQMY